MKVVERVEDGKLIYFMLAASCANFLGRGSIALLLTCICFLLFKVGVNRLKFNGQVAIWSMMAMAMVPACLFHYGYVEITKALLYPAVYLMGYCGYLWAENKEKFIKNSIFSMFIGFAVNVIITYFYNLDKDIEDVRLLFNFWTGELVAVTIVGLLSSLIIGYSFYAFFCSKNLATIIISAIAVIFTVIINFNTATRTPLFMLIIIYFVMLILYVRNYGGIKSLKSFLFVLLLIIFLVIIYVTDTFGIKTFVLESNLFNRMKSEGMSTSRFKITIQHFKEMPNYLFGGENIYAITGHQAHNYLQQLYDWYGLFPFVFLVFETIYLVAHIFSLMKIRSKNSIDFLILSVSISMYGQLLLEPIYTGYPVMFWCFIFIDGMATLYIKDRKEQIKKELEANENSFYKYRYLRQHG